MGWCASMSDGCADQEKREERADDGYDQTVSAGTISTVAGTGEHGDRGDGGPATDAFLSYPWGWRVIRRGTSTSPTATAIGRGWWPGLISCRDQR